MRSERERVPGLGNPGLSDQQAAELADTDNRNPVPPYRVTWSRRGSTELRERTFETEDSARAFFDLLMRYRPVRRPGPVLVNLKLEQWTGGAWAPGLALCGETVQDTASIAGAPRISEAPSTPGQRQQRPFLDRDPVRQRRRIRSLAWPWGDASRGGGVS